MPFVNEYDYFNDVNYSEYRELICYERPISVLLHYEYGIEFTRVFLYDRFNFEWSNGELTNNSNVLNDFYKSSHVVTYKSTKIENLAAFREFLNQALTAEDRSLLLPYYSMFGDVKISSTVLVESHNGRFVSTSLRGDNFYVRKELDVEAFFKVLYLEGQGLDYWEFDISREFVEENSLGLDTALELYGIIEKYKSEVLVFRNNPVELKGARALMHLFETLKHDYAYWIGLVDNGMSNALMIKFFWPIQFYYKPFLVFLNYLKRNEKLALIQEDKDRLLSLTQLIDEIDKKTASLNNLAILFGKRPSERRFLEFEKVFTGIIEDYATIEGLL